MMKTIYCNDELEKLIDDNFAKGKWGYGKLSNLFSEFLKNYVNNRVTIDGLKEKKKEEINNIKKSQDKLKDIEYMMNNLIEIQVEKFEVGEDEAAYLIDSEKIVKADISKLEPRIRAYNNLFFKDVNTKEFMELFKIAKDRYPRAKGYIEEE